MRLEVGTERTELSSGEVRRGFDTVADSAWQALVAAR